MKRRIFGLLALVMSVMTASAYELNAVTSEQGSISFTVGETTNATSAEEGQTVTVIVTPSTGWVVNQASGTWYAAVAATRTDLLKDVTLTFDSEDATTKAKTYHFTMARANVEISSTYKKLLTNSDITIEDITALTYTGSALQPGVTVKDGSTPLVAGTDYTVSYSNNVNAALSTATQNAPTVTVTAVSTSEKYAGTTSKTFTINKAAGSISYTMASVGKTFGEAAFTNELTVVGDGTLGYASDNASVATVNPTTGEVTIKGTGEATITATVEDKDGGNYTYATKTASYTLGVGSATMTVSAEGFTGTYDEKAHGITVTAPEGATVKYGTASGTYDLTESPTYTDAGAYTVYYQVTKPNFTTVTGSAKVTISKAVGTLSYATTTVSKKAEDEAFTNALTITGDGTVAYASSNEQVATVDETGKVTIVGAGETTITATVTDGKNYTYATKTASYTLGVGTATMTVGSDGFSGTYDEKAHGITVTAPEGATVKYGTASGTYDLTESPTYTDAGEYTVYYQVTKENFTTVTGSAKVTISKAAGTLSYATTTVSKKAEDEAFTNELTITGDGTVAYASSDEKVATVDETGKVTIVGAGETTITATVTDGKNYTYATKTASYTLGVGTATMTVGSDGFSGTYDEKAHGITVTAPEGATVKYGTASGTYDLTENPTYTDAGEYTVYYQVTKENFTTVTGSAVVTISKAAGTLSYATTTVSKKAEDEAFTNELTITGDGTVAYASSNEQVATVDETGKVTIVGAGETTITATVTDGKNYTYATKTASYTLGVGTATMTVGSDGFSGTYDEKAHGITVTAPEGATVKYGTASGTYDLTESPTYTDAGEYTVYYQVTKENFTTVTGSAKVTISKAAGTLSYATTTVSKKAEDEAFTNELTITGDGTVAYASSDEQVATVDETGKVTIVGAGETTITATVTDGKNYTYATKTASYTLGVGTAAMAVSAEGFTGTYDEKAHGITVTAPEGATVKYGTASGTYDLTENPTYTDAGEYTVYYQVTKENFTTVTGSAVVTISKAAGTLSYATTTVSKKAEDEAFTNELTITGDGTVAYASSDEQVATVDETGKVTIVGAGETTITATATDGKNYTYATKTASYKLAVEVEPTPEPEPVEPAGPTIDVDATNAENGSQEVNNVKMEMAIDESRETTQTEIIVVNPETGAEEKRTVTVVPIILENIVIPAQTDATATDKKELTVTIPGSQLSADGQTLYLVTGIKKGALKSNEPTAVVTGVILPELAMPLDIEEGALKTDDGGSMRVISPLALLDDYAVMPVLQDNLKDGKLEALVEAPARYWTLSCGVDVQVPEGVKVYKCCLSDDGKRVVTKQLSKEVLGGIIKANNGVMILGEKGNTYTVVAQYNQGITKVATTDAKSYGEDNLLTPVIEALHFEAGQVLVLKDDQWHPIKADEKLTPACKAVLVMPKAQTADENKDNNNGK